MDTPAASGSGYSDGIKWTIGLSGAAVAGAFLHLDELSKQPTLTRWVLAIAVAGFAISIISGVNYLHWLMAADVARIRIPEIEKEQQALGTPAPSDKEGVERVATLGRRHKKYGKKIERSYVVSPRWHVAYIVSFIVAAVLATIIFFGAIVRQVAQSDGQPPKSQCSGNCPTVLPPANRYLVTYSALHQGRHGKEVHTFLLDQQTGQLWLMRCTTSGTVEFQPVAVGGQPPSSVKVTPK